MVGRCVGNEWWGCGKRCDEVGAIRNKYASFSFPLHCMVCNVIKMMI